MIEVEIDLPDKIWDDIDRWIREGKYSSVSDFIIDAVRWEMRTRQQEGE